MIKTKFKPPIIQAIPLSPDDLIQVELISTVFPIPVEIEGTCYNQDGDIVPFKEIVNILSMNNYSASYLRLGYEFLLSIVAHCRTVSLPDGSCYCRLTLVKSPNAGVYPHRKVLAQGYISTIGSIGYGSGENQGPPTDHFYMENIAVSDPAAGNNFVYTCPNYCHLKLLNVSLSLTTSATVVNRYIRLRIVMPAGDPHESMVNYGHAASLTVPYNLSRFFPTATLNIFNEVQDNLAFHELYPGSDIRSFILNLQAGDQLTNVSILALRQVIPFN